VNPPITPHISVLIPAFNEEALIGRSIEAVRTSFAAAGHSEYEIIVCDNNSTDATAERARAAGAEVVFEAHNQIARARNRAAEASRGEWLIFVDADTFLNADLLQATLRSLHSGNICGGGAPIRFDSTTLSPAARGIVWWWNRISTILHVAAGSYVFCLRDAWADVEGFETSVYAGEELYFSRKLRKWGRRRGLKFRVLADSPITTSARKLEWYTNRQLLTHMIKLSIPGAIKKQAACGLWYDRPAPPEQN
jgi:glycosyltransferase involved in cell wall biosynthesis